MTQKILRSILLRVDSDSKLSELMEKTTKSRGDIVSDIVDDFSLYLAENKKNKKK